MTSTTALEAKRGGGAQRDDKLHRGRNVVLAFLMQGESVIFEPGRVLTAGWGQLFNQALLIVLLLIFSNGGHIPSVPLF
jgi:hypothetical protein